MAVSQYHLIEDLVENAIGLYITSRGSTALKAITLLKGGDETEGVTPCVEIVAGPCAPFIEADPESGDWSVSLRAAIRSNVKDTTRVEHSVLVGDLRDILIVSDFVSHLNTLAITPLNAILWTPVQLNKSVEGDTRVSWLEGILACNVTKT